MILITACLGNTPHLVNDVPTFNADGSVNAVIEIPAGSLQKWEVDKETGQMQWDKKKGKYRVVNYLAYPGNYGFIPQTILDKSQGGDGDPLDVLVLGEALPRGTVVKIKAIGMLNLLDRGEHDDKIIAVAIDSPMRKLKNMKNLRKPYPGADNIIGTWFLNYKGPGKIVTNGFVDEDVANKMISRAHDAFATESKSRK